MSRSARLSDLRCRVAEDGRNAAGVSVGVDKGGPLDAIPALPFDGEAGIGLLQVDRFGVPVPGQSGREVVGDVEQPGISGIGGKQDELTDGDHAPVVAGSLVLDVTNLSAENAALATYQRAAG